AAVLIPALAVAGLFAIERETAVADTIRAWWFLRRARRQTRARLKETRGELAALLAEIYEWSRPEQRRAGGECRIDAVRGDRHHLPEVLLRLGLVAESLVRLGDQAEHERILLIAL